MARAMANLNPIINNYSTPTPAAQPALNNPAAINNNASGLAEEYRNYSDAFQNYADSQTNWNSDGSVNWAGFTAPTWNGPAAYGLAGYEAGQNLDHLTSAQQQALLSRLHQFDPNASISENRLSSFDQSKLPAPSDPRAVRQYGSYGNDRLRDDSLVRNDPNYGPMTIPQNVRTNDSTWLDIVGPMLPLLFMGAAGAGFLGGPGFSTNTLGGNLVRGFNRSRGMLSRLGR